jgi:hypothetical protein
MYAADTNTAQPGRTMKRDGREPGLSRAAGRRRAGRSVLTGKNTVLPESLGPTDLVPLREERNDYQGKRGGFIPLVQHVAYCQTDCQHSIFFKLIDRGRWQRTIFEFRIDSNLHLVAVLREPAPASEGPGVRMSHFSGGASPSLAF